MLGLPSLDTRPQACAHPPTVAQEATFRSNGITCLHNPMGFEGPNGRDEVLGCFAAWPGFAGRHAFREHIDTDGFDHPQKFRALTEALSRRGYSDAPVKAVLGDNFRRLLGNVWG